MPGQTERGDFQVTCTKKSGAPPHQTIIAIGGHDGEDHWLIDTAMAIAWIETSTARFFTAVGGKFAWLAIVPYESGAKHLTTEGDGNAAHLLNLPECP